MTELKHISQNKPPSVSKFFGNHPDGDVHSYELKNSNGTTAVVLNYGALLQSLSVLMKNEERCDVVAGFDNIEAYMDSYKLPAAPYFGATIGRHAGRINKGRFIIDGHTYQLDQNNGTHSLHGGAVGLSRKLWDMIELTDDNNPSVTLRCHSPHMDDHFPGGLTVTVTYTLTEEDELFIEMTAATDRDTLVNLTHHSYFNMDGHNGSVENQKMYVNAKQIVETTSELIPTGRLLWLSGSTLDYSTPKQCPRKIDTTFVINKQSQPAAFLYSNKNKLKLNVFTDQPALHVYVGGNCFGQITGKDGAQYHDLSGICFETQGFADAPNHPEFPSTVLRKDQAYQHKTIYQLERI